MGTVNRFDFECDITGAIVIAAKDPLCARCMSDAEVDTNIRLLKEDLDAVAELMKAAIRAERKKPLKLG
ncbi:hypothetical protein [Azorhizobium caulinodans]|uniref:hypothetical protein n=1 Tax=Azorhizobium caulinodans TaxID=7 RepID=UPI002FBDD3FA